MRVASGGVIVFAPDVRGMLGAAALLRKLGADNDLLALSPHEAARRLYGLSHEPGPRHVYVVDLVPTDSIDTLLVPALHRFGARGVKATWIHGRDEASSTLDAIADVVTLQTDGDEAWRLIAADAGDDDFVSLAESIEGPAEGAVDWRMVLEAASSTWDWPRVYGVVTGLARLGEPNADQRSWAVEQLTEVDRALAAVEDAPVKEMGGLRVAVVNNPLLAARVRPESLGTGRGDVDAVAFVAGPGRLRLIATTPGTDLSVLRDLPGLAEHLHGEAAISGSITTPRAELTWDPAEPPAPICSLLDIELFEGADPVGAGARIDRPHAERRAKGIDPTRLGPQDRATIGEALGAGATPSGDESGEEPPGLRRPAYRSGIEIQIVPPSGK